jgi:hypothetical protein
LNLVRIATALTFTLVLITGCTPTGSLDLGHPDLLEGIVEVEWLDEEDVPADAQVPESPPALGPSSVPEIVSTTEDEVILVVWANGCRPDVTIERASPLSEANIGIDVDIDESDECGGTVNRWFISVDVESGFDIESTRLFHELDPPSLDSDA